MSAARSQLARRVRAWPRRVVITLAVVALVLIAARIALPHVVQQLVNERLQDVPGYTGSVADIDIALIRGAYTIDGLEILKVTGEVREPFAFAEEIDFSIAWRELFRGKIVSDIHVQRGELTFVAGDTEAASQKDIDRRWQEVIEDLFPLEITHFELRDGMVRYQDTTKEPHVDVFIKNMHAVATGLRNRREETDEEFPAKIQVTGDSLGGGRVQISVDAEPLAAQPHFHLAAKLDSVNLPALNESLKAYANVDVSRGTFQMAAEMAANDGGFQGYVKPFFEDLDFDNLEDKHEGVFTRIWENIVQGLAWLVKNKPRNQVGTRIPFEGRFGDPDVGLLATIANLFRHGFVRAFNPTIEGSVETENVLPSGESADGKDVAETKVDPEEPAPARDNGEPKFPDGNRAGAPTGRPAGTRNAK